MIRDASLEANRNTVTTDVCIIGAGPAGIVIANELIESGKGVILLEGGGFDYSKQSQSLYEGPNLGRPYYDLDRTRIRFFGGSTNHYAGHFGPLDAIDYERRPGLPDTGWPISRQELEPYYLRAHEYCQLGPVAYDVDYWAGQISNGPLPLDPAVFRSCLRQGTPIQFGTAYRKNLESAANIVIYINASVTDLELNGPGSAVDHARVVGPDGNSFDVRARHFVLATGGLENPRLLLNSNSRRPEGIGNENDLVGRFFMEHLGVESGLLSFADRAFDGGFYSWQTVEVDRFGSTPQAPLSVQGFLCLQPSVIRQEELSNVRMSFDRFTYYSRTQVARKATKRLAVDLTSFGKMRDAKDEIERIFLNLDAVAAQVAKRPGFEARVLFKPMTVIEQLPNPASRVRLIAETDKFGKQKLALDWQWGADDKRSLARFQQLLATGLGRAGIGRMKVQMTDDAVSFGVPFRRGDHEGNFLRAGNHHIGTTRMSASPRSGVTNPDCRVHSTSNLYVAGSSVFPTAGLWNPTLTIVALAVRLSDHLKRTAK